MISTIIWTVRGIHNQGVLERLKMIMKFHHLSVITILEPFSDNVHVPCFKVQLNMENSTSKCNGKILFFGAVISTLIFLMKMKNIYLQYETQ